MRIGGDLVKDCSNCIHECRDGSRRKSRMELNGWCAQWAYKPNDSLRIERIERSNKRAVPVIGIDEDGKASVWHSMSACSDELGTSNQRLKAYIEEGRIYKGLRLYYANERN